MATRVEAHGLLERKIACHAASAVVALASAMAMASMFAATRALSTTAFCPAKVMALGVPFSIAGSTHATTRMLSMFGLTAFSLTTARPRVPVWTEVRGNPPPLP